jgi:multiple sugar transport system permease protein
MKLKNSVREELYFLLFLSPFIIGFLVFTAYPLLSSLYLSFTDFNGINPAKFIGASNYFHITRDDLFWQSIKVTVYYTLLSVPISLVLSLFFALLINKKIPFQNFFRTSLYLPSMVSGVTMSLLWLWLFNPQIGLINFLLSKLGINGLPWLADEKTAIPSLIIMSFWGMGGGMVIFLAALKSVPMTLYESATIEGAGGLRKLWNITLPMISPVMLFQLLMNLIGSFQIFIPAYVMTEGGPHYSTWFYVYYLYKSAFSQFRIGYSSALGWILLIAVSLLSFVIIKSSNKYVYYEGGKE